MFADSLCDSTWARTSRRGWTTLVSFAVQAGAVGLLLLLPLLYTEGLPKLKLLEPDIPVPARAEAPAPKPPAGRQNRPLSNMMDGQLVEPGSVPEAIQEIDETVAPIPQVNTDGIGAIGSSGRRNFTGVTGSPGSAVNVLPPTPKPVARLPRPSEMMQGYLVHRVEPTYPPLAKTARIQGLVQLQAIISKRGTIENLRVISGHPMLVRAAIEAVQQWNYRPYILNGEPIEVETQVTVNFVLTGG